MQFDTTRNRFLAAGDEFQIKFWDMDNPNLLTAVDAEGGLPVSILFLKFANQSSIHMPQLFHSVPLFAG